MSLIDLFIKGDCGVDLLNSSDEDLEELSDQIKILYPESGTGTIEDIHWDYPTLLSFYEDHRDNEVCFYNKEQEIFDGYAYKTSCPIVDCYNADEMLERVKVKDINESEIIELFNV